MGPNGALSLNILSCLLSSIVLSSDCAIQDFRYVTNEDLQDSVEKFRVPDVSRYEEILFDIPRYQLIVGARDYLFRLTLEGLRKLEEVHWPAESTTKTTCIQKGQTESDCHNYIKVLLIHNNKIFTCGTNAFSPECTWREVNSLNAVTKWVTGVARCPYSPHFNTSALMTVSGDYYIASPLDFSARDQAIHRIAGRDETSLRTVQYDPKWLSSPDFVASYEIGNFTYFFFREEAVEYLNFGKAIYSRVARVCKNDQGGRYMLKDNWTTFLKARLNCSIPGSKQSFYFDHIQSVHYLEQDQMIYASFNTPDNSIYGSAICAYNISSIARAFNGPFKYQNSPKSAWEKATVNHRHFQCDSEGPPAQRVSSSYEIDAQRYQLMADTVQSAYQHPVYMAELQRLHHIAVDVVSTKHEQDGVHVIFVTTIEGLLRKLVVLPRKWTTCLVEEIQLFPLNTTRKIHSMKILKDLSSLYLGTDKEVMRVQLQRCKRFTSKEACLNAFDPYCGWNEHQLACTTAPHRNPQNANWLQESLTECPRTDLRQDGGWSHWSKWSECSQSGSESVGDRCLCRTRECANPRPANGGKACNGITIEVSNCTRNGQWTEWSSWSSCSATCGNAVKTRRRTCGNPAPAFGGRVCVGPERDEVYCNSNPPCPAINQLEPVDGQWSDWGTWDDCSQTCGGGVQIRRRKCNSPEPRHGGRECSGCHQDTRSCNHLRCSESRKFSPWSPWLKANATKDGYFEQRFKFICKVVVPDPSLIRFGSIKKEERFCLNEKNSCLDSAFVNMDGDWSEWSAWSRCSVPCGSGVQFRERACDNPRPSGNGDECQGIDRQERECNPHSCQAPDGWEEWSVWSLCDRQREQHRRRLCTLATPNGASCQGANKETRLCIDDQLAADKDQSFLEPRTAPVSSGGIKVEHVVSAAICGLIVGIAITGAAAFFYNKRYRNHSGYPIPLRRSKENHYVPESEYKNNFNAANDFKPKEATIKRGNGSLSLPNSNCNRVGPIREGIRANLDMDINF